jgi:hypothetical protein
MNDPATSPSELTTRTLFDVLCRVLGLSFCVGAAISLVSNLVHGSFLSLLTDSLVTAAAGAFLILRADLVQRWCWLTLPGKPAA